MQHSYEQSENPEEMGDTTEDEVNDPTFQLTPSYVEKIRATAKLGKVCLIHWSKNSSRNAFALNLTFHILTQNIVKIILKMLIKLINLKFPPFSNTTHIKFCYLTVLDLPFSLI